MWGPRIGALTPRRRLRPDVCGLDSNICVSVVPPFIVQDGYHNSKIMFSQDSVPEQDSVPNKKDEGNGEKGRLFPALSPFRRKHLCSFRRSIFAKTPPAAFPSHPRARSQVHPSPTSSEGEEDYCAQLVDRPWNRSPGLGTVLPVLTVSITLVSSSLQVVWLASSSGNSWWAHFPRTLGWILHMPCKLASQASVDGHHCGWAGGQVWVADETSTSLTRDRAGGRNSGLSSGAY